MRVAPREIALAPSVWLALVACASCGGMAPAPPGISIQLSVSNLVAPQDGTSAAVTVTVTRPAGNTNPVTLSVLSPPPGVTIQATQPGTGSSGQVTFTAQAASPAGTYAPVIQASDGATTAQASLTVVVAIVASVGTATNSSAGVGGKLENFMTTSFQPASWSDSFFVNYPAEGQAAGQLNQLGGQHIRIQALERDVPQLTTTSWNFTYLDRMVDPILNVTDHSPEFQIAVAPAFMNDSNQHLLQSNFSAFADYCANLVRYYNTTTGFTDAGGVTHVHSATNPTPITYWGIFNEPNINGLTPQQYTDLYNTVVPAMLAAGSIVPLKFSAVELADFGTEPQTYLPTFVSGVAAQVDVVSTHYYSTCNQKDTDQTLFNSIQGFVDHVNFIYSALAANPNLASVPVWVTENNVNADFNKGGGISACNGTAFVTDQRGTSAFFAAWRPMVFTRLASAGAQALYHWDYNADAQFGEVNGSTDGLYRSYWVDKWLAALFPSPPGSDIKMVTSTDTTTVDVFAAANPDGSLVVMVADHAVHASTDNNGAGDPRTVLVDVSAWPPFSSATLLTIDAGTDAAAGPSPMSLAPAARMYVALGGYGVSFLTLKP